MKRITGWDAIEYAEQHDLLLNKYDDPIEVDREGLSIEEAEDVARVDPGLIYLDIEEETK